MIVYNNFGLFRNVRARRLSFRPPLLNAYLADLLKPSFHTLCGTPIRGKLQAKGMHPNAHVEPI